LVERQQEGQQKFLFCVLTAHFASFATQGFGLECAIRRALAENAGPFFVAHPIFKVSRIVGMCPFGFSLSLFSPIPFSFANSSPMAKVRIIVRRT